MTEQELVEKVAVAISGAPFPSERSREKARAALSVIREAVKNPPRSYEGQHAIWLAAQLQNANDCYRAMIAASPIGGK